MCSNFLGLRPTSPECSFLCFSTLPQNAIVTVSAWMCTLKYSTFQTRHEAVWMWFAAPSPFYYPPEVRRGKYQGLGVFLLQYFPLVKI